MTSTTASPTTASPTTASPTTAPPAAAPTSADGGVSPRTAAVLAGIGYVALFVLAIFANFVVREGLIVADDAEATAANIADSEGLFRLGMLSFLVIFLLDIVVAWALYILFRPASRDLSLVAAWSRLVYTVFLGVALVHFFQALQLLSGAGFLDALGDEQLNAHALVALDTFNSTWLIGLTAFGVHLAVLGHLVIRSRLAPRALGYVLMAAGAAYAIDTVAHTVLGSYSDHEAAFTTMVAVPAVVAEGWFGLWLLLRAGREPVGARPISAPAPQVPVAADSSRAMG